MDVRHFSYFVEIVSSNYKLTIASKKLGLSQPALTQMITKIEKKYDITLFEKCKGRFTGLTEEGKTFLQIAQKISKEYNNLDKKLNA